MPNVSFDGRRAELGHLLTTATLTVRCTGTGHHGVAVHIQERAPFHKETEVRARSDRTESRDPRVELATDPCLRHPIGCHDHRAGYRSPLRPATGVT